ncbi:MAG: nucleoside phosphorylase [Saprospiraceae bacterium]
MSGQFSDTDLILNPDGSVYHLHLRDEHIADHVIIVGDQGRVTQISKHFDKTESQIQNREFVTHTGYIGQNRITVLSTGIGTDNIDIAINELDAAINIDPTTRQQKTEKRKLNIVRIGTSGTLQEDIEVGSQVISQFGLGLDGVLHYYKYHYDALENELQKKIREHLNWNAPLAYPYVCKVSTPLFNKLSAGMIPGITATSPGFYAPQGRRLRLEPLYPDINSRLQSFSHKNYRVTNFEMETSALYGLGNLLGHNCCTCCTIIANRITKEFSKDYHKDVDRLIETVLERIF